jgi:hypothetical protein
MSLSLIDELDNFIIDVPVFTNSLGRHESIVNSQFVLVHKSEQNPFAKKK